MEGLSSAIENSHTALFALVPNGDRDRVEPGPEIAMDSAGSTVLRPGRAIDPHFDRLHPVRTQRWRRSRAVRSSSPTT